jgi:predicted nuclease of predicted toxin-antitoxin system
VSKLLLDANLSVQTTAYLVDTFGFDVKHVKDLLPIGSSDDEVLAAAKREQWVVISFDQDFGEIYYLRERGRFGAISLPGLPRSGGAPVTELGSR